MNSSARQAPSTLPVSAVKRTWRGASHSSQLGPKAALVHSGQLECLPAWRDRLMDRLSMAILEYRSAASFGRRPGHSASRASILWRDDGAQPPPRVTARHRSASALNYGLTPPTTSGFVALPDRSRDIAAQPFEVPAHCAVHRMLRTGSLFT